MIGSYSKTPQAPLPNRTRLFDTCIDSLSLTRVECYWLLGHQTSLEADPTTLRRQHWRSVSPMSIVDRTPIIAMQPRAITAEGQEIACGNMLVVEINVIELHLLTVCRVATAPGSETVSLGPSLSRSGFGNCFFGPVATAPGSVTYFTQSAARVSVAAARAMHASVRNTNTPPASGTASPLATPS